MSVYASAWAYRREGLKPGAKFVLVTIGDLSGNDGVMWYGQQTLVEMTGMSVRTISDHVNALADAGLIGRIQRFRKNGSRTSDYTVMGPGLDRGDMRDPDPDNYPETVVKMARGDHMQISPVADFDSDHMRKRGGPDPLEEPLAPETSSPERSARVLALLPDPTSPSPKSVTHRGRRVPKETVAMAVRLLDVFNRETQRHLGAIDGTGRASATLKRILGAVLARPEVEEAEWERAVCAVVANPPTWLEGMLQVGDIFGPNASAHALANDGVPRQRERTGGARESASDLLKASGAA